MLYCIHCLDRGDALEQRKKFAPEHRAHMEASQNHGVEIVMAGPLVADDGESMIGSLFIVEAADRAAVVAFNKGDPLNRNGVWRAVEIQAFLRRRG